MELLGVCKRAVVACAVAGLVAIPCGAIAETGASAPAKDGAGTDVSATANAKGAQKSADNKDAASGADAKDAAAEKGAPAQDAADAQVVAPSDELLAWAEDMPCEACHADQAQAAEDETCALASHAALDVACVTCHVDDTLIDIHANAKADAKPPTKLKKSDVPAEACMACHTSDALIAATSQSEVLKDADGTVVNPHDLPAVKDHKKIDCDSCHKMHSSSSPKNVADELCVSCHHEDVYECYTCHA